MTIEETGEDHFLYIQKRIGYQFIDINLLKQALRFGSDNNTQKGKEDFRRLVYLGESVLSIVIADRSFKKLLNLREGGLNRLRSKLLKDESCANFFFHLEITSCFEFLDSFFSSLIQTERHKSAANFFKALLAAVYLDGELKSASKFFNRKCLPAAKPLLQDRHHFDWRRKLQEFCQKYKRKNPTYLLLEEKGPQHARLYEMGLFLEDKLLAKSEGPTKKKAANLAASLAYDQVKELFESQNTEDAFLDSSIEEPLSKTS